MRILVISDVHGNLPALEHLLNLEGKYADLVISLGDVVNYGPWSNECVDILDSLKSKILLFGNHELAFLQGFYTGQNSIAKSFFSRCYNDFNRISTISKYFESIVLFGYKFIHTIDNKYIYVDSEILLNENTFIGHTHQIFMRKINSFTLVNVGSVGQNRINIDQINYVIWDSLKQTVQLKSIDFPNDLLINELKSRQFPSDCINYLMSKKKH